MSVGGATLSVETYTQSKNQTQQDHHRLGAPVQIPEQLTIVLKGTPIAKARARSTKTGHHYTPTQTKNAEQALLMAWLATAGNRPPHAGPVHVRIRFVFEPPASWPKWKRELALLGQWPHTTKPDTDNLTKIIDGLNGRAWIDDAQLINIHARKDYGPEAMTSYTFTFHPRRPTTQPKRSTK